MTDDAMRELAREEFIVLYVADRDRGVIRTEAEYLAMYPGFEAAISREWARLQEVPAASGPPAPEAAEPPPSRTLKSFRLGGYRIERELGRGAQSTVFLARDETLGRQVALKVLKASWSGSEPLVRRFQIEARALASLDHEGLATIHDAGSDRGLEWFAMRYVDGHTLAHELERREPVGRAGVLRYVALMEKAAGALHAAHERGMVHRDVKPANIMVTKSDEPVVLDFGLVRLREIEGPALTATGDLLGTPAFMAPEQIAGKRRIDRRADVYGIGATLHELVTGGAGRDGGGRTRAPRARASRANPAVPRDLDAVIATALDPDPDRRYATAAAFADDLARVRLGKSVAVRPPGPVRTFAMWCRRAPAAAALVLIPPVVLGSGLLGLAIKNREIREAAREFDARKLEARAAHLEATERFEDFQRLDDLRALDDLVEREKDLWPPHPDQIPAMVRWLEDARVLTARLAAHRSALEALHRRGEMVVEHEAGVSPAIDRFLHAEWVRDAATRELAGGQGTDSRRVQLQKVVDEVNRRMPYLRKDVARAPRFRYAKAEDQWLNDNLARLVDGLEALEGASLHAGTIASVAHRVEVARTIAEKSLVAPTAAWSEAIAAIANPATDAAYGGLKMEPVLGLVPIGRDPASRLWEFAHVLSGEPPVRNADGRLVITPESSIVLVLIPGGASRMGARPPADEDEAPGDYVDRGARAGEGPVHEVTLDPFFISKYEMTQGQWLRATGTNPSHARPEHEFEHGYRPTLAHPVESVSYDDCEEALRRYGLVVPTEAQWERAARGATTTPWWAGPSVESFVADENLADRTYVEVEQLAVLHDPERRDGWTGSAPVGSYRPNPFGLHDVIGNVSEWCRDRLAFYNEVPALPGDGLRDDPNPDDARIVRGGAFSGPASGGRSSSRFGQQGSSRSGVIGIRPSLLLREP